MIPSDRPGTVWEARKLLQLGLLDKTVFIMPPNIDYLDGKFEDAWQRAQHCFKEVSLHLPSHAQKGLIFQLSAEGYLRDFAPLDEMDDFINLLDASLLKNESFESRLDNDTDDLLDYNYDSVDDY